MAEVFSRDTTVVSMSPLSFHEEPAVLSTRGLTKEFGEGTNVVRVLNGVDFDLYRGEIVALEGPSGCGKTTYLSICGCILTPTDGTLQINGNSVQFGRDLSEIRRTELGFVFQQFNLFPALTALENVLYAMQIKRCAVNRSEAEHLLELVGLGQRMKFLPRDLSGGQKQRVAIARALVGRPSVILVDEPTASLDHESSETILDLFESLAQSGDRAFLIVTHDPAVRRIAHRIEHMNRGRLASQEKAS